MSLAARAREIPGKLRFGARAAGFAAYALGTYAVFQATSRPEGSAEDDVRVRQAMRRFDRMLGQRYRDLNWTDGRTVVFERGFEIVDRRAVEP